MIEPRRRLEALMKIDGTWLVAGFVTLSAGLLAGGPARADVKLPPLAEIVASVGLSETEQQEVRSGKIVERTVREGSDRELGFAMALLVKAKPEALAENYRKAAVLDAFPQVKAVGRISGTGLTDFATVTLQPNAEQEARRYLDSRPGEELNLDAKEMAAFHALKSASGTGPVPLDAVEGLVRQGLQARYEGYRANGLAGIAPYQRTSRTQRRPGDELVLATKGATHLAKYVPELFDVLLNYPAAARKAEVKDLEESFYWMNLELFDRPTFVLMHRMALKIGEAYVAVDRQFYASHEYNGMQQVVAALPTPDGTLLLYTGRVSTDQVGGFGSAVKHPVARSLTAPYLRTMFETIRDRAEKR